MNVVGIVPPKINARPYRRCGDGRVVLEGNADARIYQTY